MDFFLAPIVVTISGDQSPYSYTYDEKLDSHPYKGGYVGDDGKIYLAIFPKETPIKLQFEIVNKTTGARSVRFMGRARDAIRIAKRGAEPCDVVQENDGQGDYSQYRADDTIASVVSKKGDDRYFCYTLYFVIDGQVEPAHPEVDNEGEDPEPQLPPP